MAALITALLEVSAECIHFRQRTMPWLAFRELSAPEPAPDGLPLNRKGAADRRLRVARLAHSNDLPVALQTTLPSRLRLRPTGRLNIRVGINTGRRLSNGICPHRVRCGPGSKRQDSGGGIANGLGGRCHRSSRLKHFDVPKLRKSFFYTSADIEKDAHFLTPLGSLCRNMPQREHDLRLYRNTAR